MFFYLLKQIFKDYFFLEHSIYLFQTERRMKQLSEGEEQPSVLVDSPAPLRKFQNNLQNSLVEGLQHRLSLDEHQKESLINDQKTNLKQNNKQICSNQHKNPNQSNYIMVQGNQSRVHEGSIRKLSILAKKQCRICLEDENQGRILRPCQCSGSITYAHEKCLKEWIKRKQDPRYKRLRVACELCNTPLTYKTARTRHLSIDTFCVNFAREKANFIFLFLLIFLLVCTVFGLIICLVLSNFDTETGQQIKDKMIKNENIKIVCICVSFILSILLVFVLIFFVIQYCFKTELVITELGNYMDPEDIRANKIYPKVPHIQNNDEDFSRSL